MNDLFTKLADLRHEINGGQYASPGVDYLADRMLELCDIVGDLAREVHQNRNASLRTANEASCLANGMQPD